MISTQAKQLADSLEDKRLSTPKWTDVFIHRPVLSISICIMLVLMGLKAASNLPVSQFPQIESSSLVISTPYVGAPADVVQGFVTDPIERAASTVPGIDYIDSVTTAGFSVVTVWLNLNESSTSALAELSTRLDQIRFELPAGAEDPSVEVSRADRPNAGFYLDVVYEGISRAEATDYLSRRVTSILAAIPGVQRVGLPGGRLPAMRVWLKPDQMEAFNLSATEIEAALRSNNVIATMGRTENSSQRIDLLANTALQSVDDFRRLVIREENGVQVRLGDIARISLGEEEGTTDARINQRQTIFISAWPLPGANEIAIADRLYAVINEINPTLPKGMSIRVGYDITTYMRDALKEIFITLIETVLLVGIVVVAFMGSLRTALVPLVTIPISLLGAIAAMSFMGFSLNLLTVLAIVLSVGLVVDDAIVVVENVGRFMREGMSRTEAALKSSRQLLAPIVGMTLTLAVVYAPIGFLSGLTGVLFKEFAFTLAVAVLISGVVAITLSPIMSAYVCAEGGKEGRYTQWVNGRFLMLQNRYKKMLDATLDNNAQVAVVAIFFTLLILPFFVLSKQELAPTEDQGSISVITSGPPEASLDYTTRYMGDVVDAMASLPATADMWQIVLPSSSFGGQNFVEYNKRDVTVHDLRWQTFANLSAVTGVKSFPILSPALPTAGNFDIELVVQSTDSPEVALPFAEAMVAAAYASGVFMFADTDLRIDLPQAKFEIDREKVADLGMNLSDISRQVSFLLSGNYVNRFDFSGKAYRVIPMIDRQLRSDPEMLMDIKIRTVTGDLIPLSAIASLTRTAAPRFLGKFEQKNSFRVFGGVIPGMTREQALTALETAAKDILPNHYTLDYAGESRQMRAEGNTLLGVLGIALIVVFFVLAVQFNSFRDPLIVIIGSVPLAFSGAMLFTFLDLTSINIYSQVGFITLAGLISKNAILIVEFANQMQALGLSKLDAIKQGAATRLRPVLMTTGATVLGHLPLVLVVGSGAEARNSIGIILVAGMLVGTLFTLFVLPSVYLWLSSDHHTEQQRKELTAAAEGPLLVS
ncbi:MAG: efflux RND transporter permease subunit [Porticoccaceae bacterium]|nr:efflux RND transporter permease subunit [Porticoccaceae bacterium]